MTLVLLNGTKTIGGLFYTIPIPFNVLSKKEMWLGTRFCVQWEAKLGNFQSKSVSITFLGTLLIYISFFRKMIEFSTL